jgi:carbon storage regulator
MLVITRKKGESIRIGNEIELTVLEVRDGRARIGINGPREIRILRQELIGRKQTNGKPDLGGLESQDAQPLHEPLEQ